MRLQFLMAAIQKGPSGAVNRVPSAGPKKPTGNPLKAIHPNSSPVYKTQSETALTSGLSKLSIKDSNKPPRRLLSGRAGQNGSIHNLGDVARLLQTESVKNVVLVAGAGISTPSGIPDFRSPGTGLYDNLQQYNIPYPEAIFDIDYFHLNPRPFFTLAKELYPSGKYRPNYIHYFARLLHDKGLLLRMYTQNIDGLERLAGLPAEKLVEAHGTFSSATCTICKTKLKGEEIKEKIFSDRLPRCPNRGCVGITKPDIVFFGEDLPMKFYGYMKDMLRTDLVMVMGTSLEVQPFAGIIDTVRSGIPRVLFNRESVGPFKYSRRPQDLVAAGDLVEEMVKFATLTGWKEDMVDLITREEGTFTILNKPPPARPAQARNRNPDGGSKHMFFQKRRPIPMFCNDSSSEESSETDTSSEESSDDNTNYKKFNRFNKPKTNGSNGFMYRKNGAITNTTNNFVRSNSAKMGNDTNKRKIHTRVVNSPAGSPNGSLTGRSVKSESAINALLSKRRVDSNSNKKPPPGMPNGKVKTEPKGIGIERNEQIDRGSLNKVKTEATKVSDNLSNCPVTDKPNRTQRTTPSPSPGVQSLTKTNSKTVYDNGQAVKMIRYVKSDSAITYGNVIVQDFAKPIRDIEKPTKDITQPIKCLQTSNKDIAKTIGDIEKPTKDIAKPVQDFEKPSTDIAKPIKYQESSSNDKAESIEDHSCENQTTVENSKQDTTSNMTNGLEKTDLHIFRATPDIKYGTRHLITSSSNVQECLLGARADVNDSTHEPQGVEHRPPVEQSQLDECPVQSDGNHTATVFSSSILKNLKIDGQRTAGQVPDESNSRTQEYISRSNTPTPERNHGSPSSDHVRTSVTPEHVLRCMAAYRDSSSSTPENSCRSATPDTKGQVHRSLTPELYQPIRTRSITPDRFDKTTPMSEQNQRTHSAKSTPSRYIELKAQMKRDDMDLRRSLTPDYKPEDYRIKADNEGKGQSRVLQDQKPPVGGHQSRTVKKQTRVATKTKNGKVVDKPTDKESGAGVDMEPKEKFNAWLEDDSADKMLHMIDDLDNKNQNITSSGKCITRTKYKTKHGTSTQPSSLCSQASSRKSTKSMPDKTVKSFARYADVTSHKRIVGKFTRNDRTKGHKITLKESPVATTSKQAGSKMKNKKMSDLQAVNPVPYGYARRQSNKVKGVGPFHRINTRALKTSIDYRADDALRPGSADMPRITYRHKMQSPAINGDLPTGQLGVSSLTTKGLSPRSSETPQSFK